MQPQDPNAPTSPTPNQPPTPDQSPQPSMVPPQPAPPVAPMPGENSSFGPANPAPLPAAAPAGNKKMLMLLLIIVAGVLVLGASIFGVMKMIGSSVKLERFSNDNLSVLVPVGYKKTEENGGATFEEEGEESTRSEVVAFYEKLPEGLSEEDVQQVKDSLKTLLEGAAESSASQEGQEVKNVKVTDTTFKGDEALKLTADAEKDGKKVGSYTIIAAVSDKAVYLVGVGVHESDAGLSKKVDEIINSFELK
jgi:hypothetical protein